LFVKPSACLFMLRKRTDVRVDEQIGVDENHLYDSPSATARTWPRYRHYRAASAGSTDRVRKVPRFAGASNA
jgi:hypothetical protein